MATGAIKWDQDGQRMYETGIDHGILFRKDSAGTGYEAGVPWNGLTSLDESPSGAEANDIYADNMKYLSLMSAEDFGGTINAYTYPPEFAECNGQKEPSTGVFLGQQTRRGFGMYYRSIKGNDQKGDEYGHIHHLVYNAKCSPSEMSYQTVNDSPEAIEMSWEFTTTPVAITAKDGEGNDYKATAIIKIDDSLISDKAKVKAFLDMICGTDAEYSKVLSPATSDIGTYYELVNGSYVKTSDIEVDESKTYYTQTSAATESHLPTPDEVIAFFAA